MRIRFCFNVFVFVSFSVLLFVPTHAQRRFAVSVSIAGEPSALSDLRSYIGRELRSLGDVDLVDKGHRHLDIILMKPSAGGGYVASVAILFESQCSESGKPKSTYVFERQSLFKMPDLPELAQRIVTDFDIKSLEDYRKK